MRHRKKVKKLGRTASHRKALLKNLTNQLFEHKEITTTLAKAKEARKRAERMITYAKRGQLSHRRLAFAFLRDKNSVNILFDEIAPAFEERNGGYTRVIKLGRRQGDGAPMAILQLVGFEKFGGAGKPSKKRTAKPQDKTTQQKAEVKPETEKAELKPETTTEEKPEVKAEPETPKEEQPKEEPKAEPVKEKQAEEDTEPEEEPKSDKEKSDK